MGVDIFFRGIKEGIKKKTPKYSLILYELIKSYADFKKRQNFSTIEIKSLKLTLWKKLLRKLHHV